MICDAWYGWWSIVLEILLAEVHVNSETALAYRKSTMICCNRSSKIVRTFKFIFLPSECCAGHASLHWYLEKFRTLICLYYAIQIHASALISVSYSITLGCLLLFFSYNCFVLIFIMLILFLWLSYVLILLCFKELTIFFLFLSI